MFILAGGKTLHREQRSYPGFLNFPMPWGAIEEKFHRLTNRAADLAVRDAIVEAVVNIENIRISEFMAVLGRVKGPAANRKAG